MIAKNDKEWQRLVCDRHRYICQVCDKEFSSDFYFNENGVNQYVCGHHIQGKKAFPELRHETKNGMCVCDKCHKKIHSSGCDVAEIKKLVSVKRKNKVISHPKVAKQKKSPKFWGASKQILSKPNGSRKFMGAHDPILSKSKKKR